MSVRYSHGNVVISGQAADSAPEHQFLKVSVTLLVEQGLQSKVQTQSINHSMKDYNETKVLFDVMVDALSYLSSTLKH